MKAQSVVRAMVIACLAVSPVTAWTQSLTGGGIAGVVRDTSGAVLPGVSVEAASPALIEKVRSVVTDSQGLYKFVDLRPGQYTVTFTLPGFSTMRREGIELSAAFTATVNADLSVGAVSETITVSASAPLVDTQNVMEQQTLGRTTLDDLPVAKSTIAYAAIIPGATLATAGSQDVGGSNTHPDNTFGIHGSRPNDNTVRQDGMMRNMLLAGGAGGLGMNFAGLAEMTVQTSGISAESAFGGVQLNVVPKDGGNKFEAEAQFAYADSNFQNKNLTDELRARGLDSSDSLKLSYLVMGAVGGPITRDKLWFFTGHYRTEGQTYLPGNYYNKTHGTLVYTPDLSRPAYAGESYQNHSLRLTWQATSKHKVTASYEFLNNCNCQSSLTGSLAPEASAHTPLRPNYTGQIRWTYPATNRLLFEAGGGPIISTLNHGPQAEVRPTDIAVTDLDIGYTFNARATSLTGSGNYGPHAANQGEGRVSMAYVTGSHAFKTGLSLHGAWKDFDNHINGAVDYNVRSGVPASIRQWAVPFHEKLHFNEVALYAQDQWTIDKLTLNLGLRYDNLQGHIPEQTQAAGPFVPERHFAAVDGVPNWKDLAPRVGAAYSLFGHGRTAIKAFFGRYVNQETLNGYTTQNNPLQRTVTNATRTWNDQNRNGIPDCNLRLVTANDECGALNNTAFGTPNINSVTADDVLYGFGNRFSNWQALASVEHELRQGLSLDLGYYRTWYNNFTVTDNVRVAPENYDPYCITAPVDNRLPSNVSGARLCGLFDVKPANFGQVSSLVTLASNYGKQTEVFNGIDVTMRARMKNGALVSGGLSTGTTVTDNCFVVDSPQQARPGYCHISPPWSSATQVKFLVVYPLPWELQVSGTYQNIPGIPILASYVATNAQIVPSLGRNLAAGANATATIDLIPPNTMFEPRIQQVDLRFTRIFRIHRSKINGNFDIYNLANASPILAENPRFGSAWLTPQQILYGRLFKFSTVITF